MLVLMNAFASWVESVGGVASAARLLGVTPGAVRHWLSGIRKPRSAMAAKIERVSHGQVLRASLLWPDEGEAA